MPSVEIDYSCASRSLQHGGCGAGGAGGNTGSGAGAAQDGSKPLVICTPNGNALLEIQGELVTPETKPQFFDNPEEELRYVKLEGEDGYKVKVGSLQIEKDSAVLYIGKNQRLIGSVKKLSPPLGLLKLDKAHKEQDRSVRMVDVIKYKVIFTGRPLPIM